MHKTAQEPIQEFSKQITCRTTDFISKRQSMKISLTFSLLLADKCSRASVELQPNQNGMKLDATTCQKQVL